MARTGVGWDKGPFQRSLRCPDTDPQVSLQVEVTAAPHRPPREQLTLRASWVSREVPRPRNLEACVLGPGSCLHGLKLPTCEMGYHAIPSCQTWDTGSADLQESLCVKLFKNHPRVKTLRPREGQQVTPDDLGPLLPSLPVCNAPSNSPAPPTGPESRLGTEWHPAVE